MKNSTQAVYAGVLLCLAHAAWAVDSVATPVQAAAGSQMHDSAQSPARKPFVDTIAREPLVNNQADDKALADYRALFLHGTTAREMSAFIARYADADPDKLVPRAKIRLRTFAAFEAANSAYQCSQARTLHKRILGYKVTLPFSYESCMQKRAEQGADPQALYVAGVRFEDDRERASARTLFRIILDRFPRHSIALRAADRLARLAEIEAIESASSDASAKANCAPASPVQPLRPSGGAAPVCPKDLGYIRSRMVFAELRNNPSFAEPIEGVIRKAGGLDAATAELEQLIRNNQLALTQASSTLLQQYKQAGYGGDALAFRCNKPDSSLCTANYLYHLLKEGEYYYAEQLKILRCRETGIMEHALYKPAPIGTPAPIKPRAIESASSDASAMARLAPASPIQALSPSGGAAAACPKDLGYIRSRMVFAELRNNPSFAEPIEGIIRKAGGLKAAIAELEWLIRDNQRSMSKASDTMQQYKQAGGKDALAFRCDKPAGGFCTANYYYHLLKEGEYYYNELLNSLRCRETGKMAHARYRPAPVKTSTLRKASPAAGTAP